VNPRSTEKIVSATARAAGNGFDRHHTRGHPSRQRPAPDARSRHSYRRRSAGREVVSSCPLTRVDSRYRPERLEQALRMHFDANTVRSALNGTGRHPRYLFGCGGLRARSPSTIGWNRQSEFKDMSP